MPGLLNTRDLGGLPVVGGGETRFGRVFRGPMLDFLPGPGADALINDLGIRREIDVRDDGSATLGPDSLFGQRVVERYQIPANHPDDQAQVFKRFSQEVEWDHVGDNLDSISRSPGVPHILALLADSSGQPTYIHCSVGKDRTGTICGLMLDAIGVGREAIVEDYALSSRDIEEWFEFAMGRSERAKKLFGSAPAKTLATFKSADPDIMMRMLEGVDERYGSSARYVRGLENGEAILDGLKRKLLGD
ncbi:MAG: tyrosine-protein phosphatase [Chloroflexi bacterium]|nr:tyrosine-protein phosphatase [Chloroflexota bacterium]MBT4073525.1 tyrosine-protein phosphatase [Chloroflexota bacterium]MBT4513854.1 tyrosine-protein phosphatase [Chloroflexota bacterium]MBT5318844.1 tyrosine-protein phosphatase [Chloroflexota bacterium]MBT6681388.1 tyrosine-protein phosphatase [Chloroflexota bacterium]